MKSNGENSKAEYDTVSTLLESINDEDAWKKFYNYKLSLVCGKNDAKELGKFIENKAYKDVYEKIKNNADFPLAKKSVISKMSSQKKRVIYSYPYEEKMVLKLLTYLITRKYDYIFSPNLYSFRPVRQAKDAVKRITSYPGIGEMYGYKVDIHNYFNSVPLEKFLPLLKQTLADDELLYAFLERLLSESHVISNGRIIEEDKGFMAGTPIAAFYANLYLADMDRHFLSEAVIYARYSDDIIVFSKSKEELTNHIAFIKDTLASKGLTVNPDKEAYFGPGDEWTFLGFSYKVGIIDISPVTVSKLKGKMRRKTRALQRWGKRNEVPPEKTASAFVRIFNRKLLESPTDNELSWSHWFFSVINTTESLVEIDHYAQECIRYLMSGRRTKSRYNVRYEDMKKIGYKSLVNEYYK